MLFQPMITVNLYNFMAEKEFKNKIKKIDSSVKPVPRILARNIQGMHQTVSVAPTSVPLTMQDQIQIFVDGGTLRLYWYDVVGGAWHYVTAIA